MPIPNEQDASYLDQSELDSGDIKIWEAAMAGYWVTTGVGTVAAQGTPDGTVAVSGGGTVRFGGTNKTLTTGNVSVLTGSANQDGTTGSAADSTLARFSLITLNSSAQLGVLHGTGGALSASNDGSYDCSFPDSTGKVVLASIFIPPGFTAITASMINDKRIIGSVNAYHDQAHTLSSATSHSGDLVTTQMPQLNAWSIYHNATSSTADPTVTSILYLPVNFSQAGTLAITDGPFRWYNRTGRTLTFDSVTGAVGTAPTGADIIVDVNVNGTTIMTSTKVVIAATTFVVEQTTFSTTTIADNSYLEVDIDQIGSTIQGSNLTVTVWLKG